MAELSTGDETVRILDDLVKVLKDERVFDSTGTQPVVNFVHPKELQVSRTSFSFNRFRRESNADPCPPIAPPPLVAMVLGTISPTGVKV